MINKKELIEKVEFWKEFVGLGGWNIKSVLVDKDKIIKMIEKIDGKKLDDDDVILGAVVEQYTAEQTASIIFWKDADKEFGLQLNIDTLILHELIHLAVGEQFGRLPKAARSSPRVKELEEFICDFFARRIYDASEEEE